MRWIDAIDTVKLYISMKRRENFCALEETSVLKPDMYFLQYVHPTKPTVALMSDVIFVYLWHFIYLFIYLFILYPRSKNMCWIVTERYIYKKKII